jgi:6-phosphogluconolactonase
VTGVEGSVEVVDSVPEAFARLVLGALPAPGGDRFSLFLSGGGTAQDSYRALAAASVSQGGADWGRVDVFLGDERCVEPDDPDSNHKMIAETLLDVVGPVGSDNPMYERGTPAEAAAAYQDIIGGLATFDLVHLGLGPDGHTASLFPDSTALAVDDPDVLVVANHDPNENNPHDRITLTLPAIARARLVVFTVSGRSKREPFGRIVAGADLPGGRVTAERVVWLVDADAAGDTVLAS